MGGTGEAGGPGSEPDLDGLDLDALSASRWFASKGRRVVGVEPLSWLAPAEAPGSVLVLALLHDDGGGSGRYALPLVRGASGPAEAPPDDPLWPALAGRAARVGVDVPEGPGRTLGHDQSNTAVVLGERVVVKLLRLVDDGPSPEAELLHALDGVDGVPPFLGTLELGGATVAILQGYVPHVEAGWEPFVERVAALAAGAPPEPLLSDAQALGTLLARVHVALAERRGVVEASAAALEGRAARAAGRLAVLAEHPGADERRAVARARTGLLRDLEELRGCEGEPLCRIHGDVHVGQVLRRADGSLALVDFDGEPGLGVDGRRAPWTPLYDVASLLLSLDNAVAAARRRAVARGLDDAPLDPWSDAARDAALMAWTAGVEGSPLRARPALLRASLADKQIAELTYAARFLPEWLYAPLEVLRRRFT